MRLRYSYFVLIVFLSVSAPAVLSAHASPDSLLARGMAQYEGGAYQEALPLLSAAAASYRAAEAWEPWTEALSGVIGCHLGLGTHRSLIPTLHAALDTLAACLGPGHRLVAQVCNDLGTIYNQAEDCAAAMPLFQRAFAIRQASLDPDDPSLGTTLINLASCAEHQEGFAAANGYLEQALAIWSQAYGPEDHRLAKIYNNLGWNYGQMGEYDRQLAYYQRVVALREQGLGPFHPYLITSYLNLGMAYYRRGYYEEALSYLEKAQAVFVHNGTRNTYQQGMLYNSFALVHQEMGDPVKARHYLWQLLEVDLEALGKDHFYVGISYHNLAQNEQMRGAIPEALAYARQALAIIEALAKGQKGSYQVYLGKTLGLMSELNLRGGQADSALYYLRRARRAYAASGTDSHAETSELYLLEANLHEEAGQHMAAQQALSLAIAVWGDSPTLRVVEPLEARGAYWLRQGELARALADFDTAAAAMARAGQAHSHPAMLGILSGQAATYLRLGDRDTAALRQALLRSQQAAALIAHWRRSILSPEAWARYLHTAAQVYETGIAAAWALAQLAPHASWLEQAFALSEQGKATLLYQGLREAEALQTGGVPPAALRRERQLRLDRAFYQKKIYEASPADHLHLGDWRQQLFRVNQAHDSLIRHLEATYPAYYRLKYDQQTASLAATQAFLRQQQAAALCYVTGEVAAYVFYLTADTIAFLRLPHGARLHRRVARLRHHLLAEGPSAGHDTPSPDSLFAGAYSLYQQLLAPAAAVQPLPSRLFVIPDGPLGYLSFDLLLTSPPEPGRLAYLIYGHSLAYAYSATLLQYQPPARTGPGRLRGLLAVAPGFRTLPDQEGAWQDLPYALAEAKAIHNHMGGKILHGAGARESVFRRLAPAYQLIHLSSHAQVDDDNPLFSRVAFAPAQDSTEDGQLDLAEIFALSLQAEMVVLSACETGTGQLMRGEGIASLARGFAYAGAQSIITTLWPVSDAATAEIMTTFYTELRGGCPKDEALRRAKLAYLTRADRLGAHPFYWAGYTPLGNMRRLPPRQWRWEWFASLLLLIGGAGWWYARRARR